MSKYAPSILEEPDQAYCRVCGSTQYIQRHEVFYGVDRQASIKNGCWITICIACHDIVHSGKDRTLDRKLKKIARKKYIELYGEQAFAETFSREYTVTKKIEELKKLKEEQR